MSWQDKWSRWRRGLRVTVSLTATALFVPALGTQGFGGEGETSLFDGGPAADAALEALASRSLRGFKVTDPEERSASWARTRAEFGFDAAPGLVRNLYESHGVSPRLGVPLSPAEERDLDRRASEREQLPAFQQQLDGLQPDHGGVYIDQARGGIVVALVTRPLAAGVQARLKAAANLRAEFRQVEYSQQQLAAAREQVRPLLGRGGDVDVLAIGTDIKANRVIVGVRTLDDRVRARFRELHPAPIFELYETGEVETIDAHWDSPGPLKSGLQIVKNGRACTTGFMVQSRFSATGSAILTAGHCITELGWGEWTHGGVVIGRGVVHGFVDGSRADVAEIEVPWGMTSNLMWWNPNHMAWLNGVEAWNANVVGDGVCKHGQTTGLTCGTIQGLCDEFHAGGVRLFCQRRTTMHAEGGDSGSGVWKQNNNFAAGILVGIQAANVSYYSHVGEMQPWFGNRVYSEWRATPVMVRHSGLVIDVPDARQDLVQLIQWPWVGAANQMWYFVPVDGEFYALVAAHSGQVADVGAFGQQDGAPIVQWPWHGGHNQQYDLRRRGGNDFEIVARHSGKCVDVSNVSQNAGAGLHQWHCHGGGNQRWFIPF